MTRLAFRGQSVKTVDAAPAKLDRSVFLYMQGTVTPFAQCGTCALRNELGQCTIMDKVVPDEATCGLYIPGSPCDCEAEKLVEPADVGYVEAAVRCENCAAFSDAACQLYDKLNNLWPEKFALDTQVKPTACCNGWMKR